MTNSDFNGHLTTINTPNLAASLELTKSASKSLVLSGETFKYTLAYRCASTTENCVGTVITDPLPASLEFVGVSGSAHTTNEQYNSGSHTVTFTFINPLPAGSTGTVEIEVRFPNGTTPDGTVASNTATISASNATSVNSNQVNVTADATDKFYTRKVMDGGGAPDGYTAYNIEICNTGFNTVENGTLNPTNITITDPLPAGSVYVQSDWPGVYNSGSHTVTWSLSTILPGVCEWYAVVVTYPTPSFSVGSVVTNSGTVSYTPVGESSQSLPFSVTHTLSGPTVDVGAEKDFASNSRYPGQYSSFSFDWWNSSNVDLPGFYLEDSIPTGLEIKDIGLGAHYSNGVTGDVRLTIKYQTNLNSSWTNTPNSPFQRWDGEYGLQEDVDDFGLAAGEYITVIRWDFGPDPMPIASGSWIDVEIDFKVMNSASPGTIQNCMTAGYDSGTIDLGSSRCDNLIINNLITGFRPSPEKAIDIGGSWETSSSAHFNPGDTLSFRLEVRNSSSAAGDLVDPVVVDLLPPELEFISGSMTFDEGDITGAPAPIFTETADYKGTGRKLLKWEWTGASSVTLPPNNDMYVYFDARIDDYAPAGLAAITNQYSFLNETTNNCSGGFKITDALDFDDDSSTTDEFCTDDIQINIFENIALESDHFLKGQLDVSWTQYPATGTSVPGGIADYQVFLYNKGNVALDSIVFIDILPFIGDAGVIDPSTRDSRWRPNLVGAVSVPTGGTVYYSTEGNPCRDTEYIEPTGPVGCQSPNWSTSLPADITTVQSLKFEFGSTILQPGDTLVLEWPMRVPVTVLNTIGTQPDSIAWNSFGYVGRRVDNGSFLLASEPVKVGIAVQTLVPGVFGNYVWEDTDQDGIQDAGESGVDGIRIELYKDNGDGLTNQALDSLVSFTLTTDGGYYLFPNLATGDYYAVFEKPAGYRFTIPDAEPTDTLDSDGIARVIGTDTLAFSRIITILDTETNMTIDLGIYPGTQTVPEVCNNGVDDDGDGYGDCFDDDCPCYAPVYCDGNLYQTIAIGTDFWLYQIQTQPVSLNPLVNLTTAGVIGNINNAFYNENDGFIYFAGTSSPYRLYRVNANFVVEYVGNISGFPSGMIVNAAGNSNTGEIYFRYPGEEDFYELDLSTLTATLVCDFPAASWPQTNIGDFAYNPVSDRFYGTRDSTNFLIEIDLNTCSMDTILLDSLIPGALGAFFVSADGTGYGYANDNGNLYELNLTSGAVQIVGSGSNTSNTDGCSCSDLMITKAISKDSVCRGEVFTYTFNIFNQTGSILNNVTFGDTLPAGLQFYSDPKNISGVVFSGSTAITGNNSASLNLQSISMGASNSFEIEVIVLNNAPGGTLNNQAVLSGIPPFLPPSVFSDDPNTVAINDSTAVVIQPCPEDCTNGIDDDLDGQADCNDTECMPTANNTSLNACDNSGSGSGTFFLHDANSAINNNSGISISFHPTLIDAVSDLNILYSPFNSNATTIYARVEELSAGCINTAQLDLVVGPACVENCDNNLDDDGDTLVDCEDPDCPCCDASSPTISND